MAIQVHEIVKDTKVLDIFKTLPGPWGKKWLSQDQIIQFCKTLPARLRQENFPAIFLAKRNENEPIDENNPEDHFVVVIVNVFADGLWVHVSSLGYVPLWHGEDRYRVVSPQLKDLAV